MHIQNLGVEIMWNKSDELFGEANNAILFTAVRPDIIMEKGKGMYLWDTNGKKYLDFIGGWAVTSLGHCPDAIINALEKQACELINTSPAFYNKPMIEFAKLLKTNSCFDKVFFTSTGAEANEGAIKLARKYGEKYLGGAFEIITTINGFHGRTLATMSASGKDKWQNLFEPKVSGFKHVPFNDIEAIFQAINSNTCAIMLEPIQGEGGVNVADKKYIKELRKICDEKGILLIFDEVQTGIGRTGKLFAYEHFDVEPDIITLAKGIGGGFPLSALLAKEKYNVFDPGDQGGTYTGQPLAMAVGLAVVSEVMKIYSNAELQGKYLIEKLNALKERFNIKDIRGMGLLVAIDLPSNVGSDIVSECLKNGLIVNSPKPATIRFMPPLIVTQAEIDQMIEILYRVLDKVLTV